MPIMPCTDVMINHEKILRDLSFKISSLTSYLLTLKNPDEIVLYKEMVDTLHVEFIKAFCKASNLSLVLRPILSDFGSLVRARLSIDKILAKQQPPTVSAVPSPLSTVPQYVNCGGGAQAESASPPTTNSANKREITFEAQFLPLLSSGEIKTRKELADLIDKVDMALITAKLLANEGEKHCEITDGLLICLVKAKLIEPLVSELHELFDDDKLYTWEEFKKEVGNPNQN